jgi:hypothetical protein
MLVSAKTINIKGGSRLQHITLRLFNQLVSPVMSFLPQLIEEWQGDFAYRKFFSQPHFLLSLLAHLSQAEGSNDLATQLSDPTLPTTQMVGHLTGPIAPSTLSRANQQRPYQIWQAVFVQLYHKASPHFKKLHLGGLAELNQVRLVDGSLFSATTNMLWATYCTTKNKLKGHFFMDLNGLPDQLIVSDGKASERAALLGAVVARVTYVFDRGYNSYDLFAQIELKQAYFVTRLLDNACFKLHQSLSVSTEEAALGVLSDELIEVTREDGLPLKVRLVRFQTERGEMYRYLTNRLDLSALNIVRLYLWRWEIELLFAWLKRHLVFSHWYSENENGVRIQLFAGLICYLLLRLYAASQGEIKVRIGLMRYVRQHLCHSVTEAEITAYQHTLNDTIALEYCYTFPDLVLTAHKDCGTRLKNFSANAL